MRDSYGVEIEPNQDDALILALVVCIDQMGPGQTKLASQEERKE